jgi:hypothetical protein
MSHQAATTKKLVIRLTDKERERIKRVTGELVTEVTIGTMEACVKERDDRDREGDSPKVTKQLL